MSSKANNVQQVEESNPSTVEWEFDIKKVPMGYSPNAQPHIKSIQAGGWTVVHSKVEKIRNTKKGKKSKPTFILIAEVKREKPAKT